MALQPTDMHHKMKKIFEEMKKGRLKGQTEHVLTISNASKALSGQYSAKLKHFKPFQGLTVSRCSYASYLCRLK